MLKVEDAPIELDRLEPRQVFGGDDGHEADQAPGEQDAERAAGDADDQALGDQLAREAAPRRAERGADGHFAFAGAAAREQQVRDVGAGDEEDERDAGHQDHERGLELGRSSRRRRSGRGRRRAALAEQQVGDERARHAARGGGAFGMACSGVTPGRRRPSAIITRMFGCLGSVLGFGITYGIQNK